MTTFNLKQSDYLKTWAIFWIASTVCGAIVSIIAGAVLGFVLGGLGASMQTIKVLCGGLGFLLAIPVSYFFFQLSIQKFLLPKISTPQAQDLPERLAA